jgi:carboxypeptidase Q
LPRLEETHRATADRLIEAALASNDAWRKLSRLCDEIGPRLSGSAELARAVDWAAEEMKRDGLARVRRQPVMVPHWVRGEESARLVAPREAELALLGLGRSVGTPPDGIVADVVVVRDFAQLAALPADSLAGKIVLYDAPFTNYGETVEYRWSGANEAARRGARACLIRSVGKRSLGNPHTGAMAPYEEGLPRIPAAALSIEDAAMIARLAAAGHTTRVHLTMGARMLPDVESHNVIGEIPGRERPEEIVVIGGHLDSWDVGQGAHDDGGGCVVAMAAARLLVELELRARRTIRVVLWTNEENGTRGAKAYHDSAAATGTRHFAAIEADAGVEAPRGFGVTVWQPGTKETDAARQKRVIAVAGEIAALLAPIGADTVTERGGGVDISPLMQEGVPGLALRTAMDLYWDLHHSVADTMDKVNPPDLQRNVAAMAVMAYVMADLPGELR